MQCTLGISGHVLNRCTRREAEIHRDMEPADKESSRVSNTQGHGTSSTAHRSYTVSVNRRAHRASVDILKHKDSVVIMYLPSVSVVISAMAM